MNNFMQHVADFGLSYGTIEEFNFRQNTWAILDEKLNAINASQNDFTVGHNFLSTWTADEKKRMNGWKPSMVPLQYDDADEEEYVSNGEVNWVT